MYVYILVKESKYDIYNNFTSHHSSTPTTTFIDTVSYYNFSRTQKLIHEVVYHKSKCLFLQKDLRVGTSEGVEVGVDKK